MEPKKKKKVQKVMHFNPRGKKKKKRPEEVRQKALGGVMKTQGTESRRKKMRSE